MQVGYCKQNSTLFFILFCEAEEIALSHSDDNLVLTGCDFLNL